ncbi:MAG: hypothetical protein LBN99_06550 [Oscillospiraceae bacterium]|jgi:hypothetical protein|nr:hypothetical protein [Oscillospiraceae bacterium]
MTNVEKLTSQFAAIPRIEETGPQHGYNGTRMARKGLRTRLIHAVLCVLGILPFVLSLAGVAVPKQLISVGFGLIVPGGGFMAAGGPITLAFGLYICFYLWKKKAMFIQDIFGSFLGIAGFWLLGALGGFLAGLELLVLPKDATTAKTIVTYVCYCAAVVSAFVLFGTYELRVKKMYKQMDEARAKRIPTFNEAITELEELTAAPIEGGVELDEEQILASRFFFDVTVNREKGDMSGFTSLRNSAAGPDLSAYHYQLSAFGYGLMLLHAKYLPNFQGYLKDAHRFLIQHYSDPRTCGYWPKEALTGYFSKNPDPIYYADIMLSGWMMPVVAGFSDQYGDKEFEQEAAIKFQPFKDKPEQTYDYSSEGIVKVIHRQLNNKEFPYMLIPCEPHVSFPTCNSFGFLGMLMFDRDHGTHYCEDVWKDLYDNLCSEFIEIDGSMALRRQDQYGLRHLPSSQIGYNAMADVQNYLHYLPIFPGLARRNYALIRKHEVEIRDDGVAYVKDTPWEKMVNMFTQQPDPSLQMGLLAMTAAEYGDTQLVDALRKAETKYLSRSNEPNSFKFKDVNTLTVAYFAFSRLCKKGYWSDVILRGMPETSKTGPILTDCAYPDVIAAKAVSSGEDLELVLYNGAEAGEQSIKIERLKPGAEYTINGGDAFSADADGAATLSVNLNGRTPLHIERKV